VFVAITRQISRAFENCELTHLQRQPIDIPLARQQHQTYIEALKILGCQVQVMPEEPHLPDSVFVEDTAVVFDDIAILTRPGAVSRRPETDRVSDILQNYRQVKAIQAPGTVDGGDVLCIRKKVYVGLSSRTNFTAISQMQAILSPYGYELVSITMRGGLHLKSAVTKIAQDTLLMNSAWVDAAVFGDMQILTVDPLEPQSANALWIGEGVIYPLNFPRTWQKVGNFLDKRGMQLLGVDISELQKAEGAVTCCSLVFQFKEV
jgi:dimethylargininase